MAHSYYSEKAAGFDQARHDASLSVPQAMRRVRQQELTDRRNSSCISPAAELDGKLRNPQRRRVPVACGRCRRRKIKCSGDSRDGLACSNCRSCGNTDCQFLRVNSLELQTKGNGYPYPPPGLAPSPQLSMYTTHTPGKPVLLSMGSPQTRMSAFQRAAEYDVGAFDAHFVRPSRGMESSIHYDDEQSANYTSQSSAYLLPSTPSGVMIDYGACVWSPKAWNSVLNANKSTNGGIFAGSETSSSMNQSAFNYVLPSQGVPSTELQATNTPLVAVTSADAADTTRTLPAPPACRSQQQQSTLTGLSAVPESLTSGNLSSDFKSVFWNARCRAPTDQQATSLPAVPSTDTYTTSPRPRSKSSGSSDDTPDLVFGYLPMPTTSEDISPPLTAAATMAAKTSSASPPYGGFDALDSSRAVYRTTTASEMRRLSRDNSGSAGQRLLALTTDCTPGIYGYTSSEKSKTRTSSDGDDVGCSAPPALINGLPYTRVRHPDTPTSAFAFNLLPTDAMPDYHRAAMQNVHRPSVSPLGHQGAY